MKIYTTELESKVLMDYGLDMSNALLCIKDGEVKINKNEEGTIPVYTFTELWDAIPETFVNKNTGEKLKKFIDSNGISFIYAEPKDEEQKKHNVSLHHSIRLDAVYGATIMLCYVLRECKKIK